MSIHFYWLNYVFMYVKKICLMNNFGILGGPKDPSQNWNSRLNNFTTIKNISN